MSTSDPRIQEFRDIANQSLRGKPEVIDLALCCLFAGGHLLIEDRPGVGKTTLVKLLARLSGLEMNRIQCTNDLLPGDILGGNIIQPGTGSFIFQKGPVFSQILIADELNRASPRSQSACLQAMEEKEVSVDGVTYSLPDPFLVVATQNPQESIGTFPLPESQFDRFLMRLEMGYPDRSAEREILERGESFNTPEGLPAIFKADDILEIQKKVRLVHMEASLLDYIQDLVAVSRQAGPGMSTRAALDLVRAARAKAYLSGRNYCLPDDIKSVFKPVTGHRSGFFPGNTEEADRATGKILEQVSTP